MLVVAGTFYELPQTHIHINPDVVGQDRTQILNRNG